MDFLIFATMILFSIALLLVCFVLLHRVRVENGANKTDLLSQGFRLTIYAGILLSVTLTLNEALTSPNEQEFICQSMRDLQQTLDPYFAKNCVPSVSSLVVKKLLSNALLALSWLIPLTIAGIGVGVMTSALLMPRTPSESDEPDFFSILPEKTRGIANWFNKNIS